MDKGGAFLAGTMTYPDGYLSQGVEYFHGCQELFFARRTQVGTTDNGTQREVAEYVAKMLNGVDQPRMGAAKEENVSLSGRNGQGRVIVEGIGLMAGLVRFASHQVRVAFFEPANPGNLPAEPESLSKFGALVNEAKTRTGGFKFTALEVHADTAPLIAPDEEPFRENPRMCIDRSRPGALQQPFQPTRVIIVTMTEHNGINGCGVDAQHLEIVHQRKPPPRVKQQATCRRIDQAGKSMLAKQRQGAANRILADDRQANGQLLGHRIQPPGKTLPTATARCYIEKMKFLLLVFCCLVTTLGMGQVAVASADQDSATGEACYLRCCASCHDSGIGNAQLLGDREGWQARLNQGENTLIAHSLNGFVGPLGIMPARGQCPELTDDEVIAAVRHIINKTR